MTQPTRNSASRCKYRNAAGRQCRSKNFGATSRLCPRHSAIAERTNGDITELFTIAHDKLRSPAGIHAALSQIFTLLAEDRISARCAAVLAYISNLLLRTQLVIHQQAAGDRAAAHSVPPDFFGDLLDQRRQRDQLRLAAASLPQSDTTPSRATIHDSQGG